MTEWINSGLLQFYDQGWDARVRGEPFNHDALIDWKNGWKDCDGAPAEDRKPFEEIWKGTDS